MDVPGRRTSRPAEAPQTDVRPPRPLTRSYLHTSDGRPPALERVLTYAASICLPNTPPAMNRSPLLALALAGLLGACATSSPVAPYEHDDLISMRHNKHNGYAVLLYRGPLGQLRQVVRQKGVCEMVITYAASGDITLKEPGEDLRHLQPTEADALALHIKTLLRQKKTKGPARSKAAPSATV